MTLTHWTFNFDQELLIRDCCPWCCDIWVFSLPSAFTLTRDSWPVCHIDLDLTMTWPWLFDPYILNFLRPSVRDLCHLGLGVTLSCWLQSLPFDNDKATSPSTWFLTLTLIFDVQSWVSDLWGPWIIHQFHYYYVTGCVALTINYLYQCTASLCNLAFFGCSHLRRNWTHNSHMDLKVESLVGMTRLHFTSLAPAKVEGQPKVRQSATAGISKQPHSNFPGETSIVGTEISIKPRLLLGW